MNESTSRKFITDAILISAGTGLIYAIAYVYEFGYCQHFGIPPNLISLSITTILVAGGAVAYFSFTLFQLSFLFLPFIRFSSNPGERLHAWREFLLFTTLIIVLGLLFGFIYGFSWKGFKIFLALLFILYTVVAATAALYLLYSFLRQKIAVGEPSKPTGISKTAPNYGLKSNDPWDYIERAIGRNGLAFVAALILLFAGAYLAGNSEAARQSSFMFLEGRKNFAILRIYGDQVIAGEVDTDAKMLRPRYLLLRIASGESMELKRKIVGPLTKTDVE